jgi:diaminopimelate epimerase
MKIDFIKMHGIGNDMIVINSLSDGFVPSSEQSVSLCERRTGIGADQILILLPSQKADYKMLTINSDGSEVEMCGNGIRCLARYIKDHGISDEPVHEIETLAGIIKPELVGEMVKVDMDEPVFDPEKIPVKGDEKVKEVKMPVDEETFRISAVSMGNPHCVIVVDDVEKVPLKIIGPRIERHPWFPQRTNVEFVEIVSKSHIKVRVWERGAGITLACGTGACGAAVACIDRDLVDREVKVTLPGGELDIKWDEESNRVFMTGVAVEVFTGTIEL